MADFKDIQTKHADAFKDITGVDTVIDGVTAKLKELGYSLIVDNTKEPEYVPKSRLNEVITQRNTYKTDNETYLQQLETLKKEAKGNEVLTAQIQALQDEVTGWQGKHKDATLASEIKLAAMKLKANDPGDVLAFVDKTKLELNTDGTIKGLDEQLAALQTSKPYLFAVPGAAPGMGGNPPHQPSNQPNPWAKETFNLTQQGKIFTENPAMAETMKVAAGVK
ncbi:MULTISPECIES: phage scaffolding protein [Pelosinus]|uniref:Minor structural GP20 protein n=1 Tax=Pelosinus fermentans B4 TaxID=1149862 RepID=I9LJL4_9FIRM|nr:MULTISPECIES: phage scaffolding protein [Pelosinus]EIW20719.1 minor structural GP20 protein [Pelosinus fermentans B4]EIW25436.1 minor structural GP20 protein [Pelosinus fermentans A11]OAM93696.1 minor structural GP20 protein [Pelosinus fermentans DSM 17108]SDQ86905.1 Phage minor structural protein GP20 [Pelosinus fermentans]